MSRMAVAFLRVRDKGSSTLRQITYQPGPPAARARRAP